MNNIKHALILSLAVPALSLATGCSSSSDSSGSGGSAGSSDTPGTFALVDDFEMGMGMGVGSSITSSLTPPFNGGWFTYSEFHDQTNGGKDPQLNMAEADEHDGLKGKSKKALHVTGGTYASFSGFGTEINADPATGKKLPYNASEWVGLEFYAKTVAPSGTLAVQAATPDSYPTPGDLEAPVCKPDAPDGDPTRCNDDFESGNGGKSLMDLTSTWQLYKVKFSDMAQQGWGQAAPNHVMNVAKIYSIKFVNPLKVPVDLWIDDVAFYK